MPKVPKPGSRQEPPPGVPRDMLLGQVKASLRPTRLDVAEIREVLLAALSLGYDPSDLYLQALQSRPPELGPAPPLDKVLPQEVLNHLSELEDHEQSMPEGEPPGPAGHQPPVRVPPRP